jgi:putative hydrolase of HD superfamily
MKTKKQKISNGMKEVINFLIAVSKLKTEPRSGWVLAEVKNPETIAEHTFRVAIASWLFAEKRKLNVKRAIMIALFHDICEVYAGDITPFIYYPNLPRDKEKRKKMLMKWARLSKNEKQKRGQMKFEKEKKGLLKLIKSLSPDLKNEIFSMWVDYEKGISKEGRFVNQLNRIETLLQSITYFGTKNITKRTNWWEWTEEIVDDPLLLDFLKVIHKKLYGESMKDYEMNKELENILDFLLEIGKLKEMSRLYWKLRKVKNPETVASHMFDLALMTWAFNKEKSLNTEKLLKMALCHEMSAVYTGDTTPYDRIMPKNKKEKEEVLKRWSRITKDKKKKIFLSDYKEEKEAIKRLTKKLDPQLRNEMIQLWREYRTKSTPEGYLLSQLNVLAVLIQALLYEKIDKNCSAAPIWEWAFEACDNKECFDFLEGLKKKFYK